MKRECRGSFTIEAALVLPMLLLLFGMVLQIFFYYHDKNIILAMGNEVTAAGEGKADEYEKIIQKKLLLFTEISIEITREEEQVLFVCEAKKGRMMLRCQSKTSLIKPEETIRKIEQIEEEIKS